MALPRDENGLEIARGDLVLLDDKVFKVIEWEEVDSGFMVELVCTGARTVVKSTDLLGLGPDKISGLRKANFEPTLIKPNGKKNGKAANGKPHKFKKGDWVRHISDGFIGHVKESLFEGQMTVEYWVGGIATTATWWSPGNCELVDYDSLSEAEQLGLPKPSSRIRPSKSKLSKSHPRRFYVGDHVYHTKYKQIGKVVGTNWGGDNSGLGDGEIRIEFDEDTGSVVEDWDGGECIISAVGSIKTQPSQAELGGIFGPGYRSSYEGWDWRKSGSAPSASRSRKPKKKDSITKHDMISQEVRRLQNEERRDRIMGKEPDIEEVDSSKPKIKTRKGSW